MSAGEARNTGYVAVDRGPELALKALAARLPGRWLEAEQRLADFVRSGLRLLVCGTSDSAEGRAVESAARRAARERGMPVAVIEDFPGNYCHVPGGEPDVIFVESEFAARLARAKDASPSVEVCPSVRYDSLRRKLSDLRSGRAAHAVLWIGQPETRDSLETLKRLLPALEARGIPVWFRAHPRDAGYAGGAYAGLPVEDLTARPLEECLARRPRLVVTQFSSVAIEAGFWGIPSLNALFDDLGAKTLAAKKGYAVPPWCEEGAAFLVRREAEVRQVLRQALDSAEARASVLAQFDRYFRVTEDGGQCLMNVLYNHGLLGG